MKVYLAYTASGVWEDYYESVRSVFSTRQKAIDYLHKLGYKDDGETYNGNPSFICEHKEFWEKPQREDYDDEKFFEEELEDWEENHRHPIYSETYYGWIEEREVDAAEKEE